MFTFPPYLPPIGGPHYWRNEQTGRLEEAVQAYFDNRLQGSPVSPADCELVADYIRHWINAPMYDVNNPYFETSPDEHNHLKALRDEARHITDADSIDRWIHKALDLGLDPF